MNIYEKLCDLCNGSGEGRASNTRCSYCGGWGVVEVDEEGNELDSNDVEYKDWFPGDDDF